MTAAAPSLAPLPLVQLTAPERIWLTVSDCPSDEDNSFPDDHEGVCWSIDDPVPVCVPYVRADVAEARAALQADTKADAFKAYVHQRLDSMGVPHTVPSPHTDAGCRVGGRLDYVESALQADRAAVGDGMVIGATHCVGDKWFKEITIGPHTLLAPLDDFTGAAAMLANAFWPRKDTAPPAAVPAGFVLVPVKPTTPMMDAPSKYRPGFSPHVAADIYRDMLAAAPKQPADEAPAKGDCPVCDGEFSDSCSRCSLQSQDSPT